MTQRDIAKELTRLQARLTVVVGEFATTAPHMLPGGNVFELAETLADCERLGHAFAADCGKLVELIQPLKAEVPA